MTDVTLSEWELIEVGHETVPGPDGRYALNFECHAEAGLWGNQHGPIYHVVRAHTLMVGDCGGCGLTVIRPVQKRMKNAPRYAWASWMYLIEEEP